MKKYIRPVVNEVVTDINEPVCLYDSTWFASPCYYSTISDQQFPEQGNNALRFQINARHNSRVPAQHTTNYQWVIIVFENPIDPRVFEDINIDSEYRGGIEKRTEVGADNTRVRFNMAYFNNESADNIGIGDCKFEWPASMNIADCQAAAQALYDNILGIEIHDVIGG